jgi:hypothetical protein
MDLSGGTKAYLLKPEWIFDHFKTFLEGFNSIIEPGQKLWIDEEWEALEEFAKNKAYADYLDYLATESNGSVPFYEERGWPGISVSGLTVMKGIIFYMGSYKAELEEYSTLSHMEKLLLKAFDHPLSKVAKFCIFG